MVWDSVKAANSVVASADWNAMVTDQKGRATAGACSTASMINVYYMKNYWGAPNDASWGTTPGTMVFNTSEPTIYLRKDGAGSWVGVNLT